MKTNIYVLLILLLTYVACGDLSPTTGLDNNAPVIVEVHVEVENPPFVVGNGTKVFFVATAIDDDGDQLFFTWECPVGVFQLGKLGERVEWFSPAAGTGPTTATVTVTDRVTTVTGSVSFIYGN